MFPRSADRPDVGVCFSWFRVKPVLAYEQGTATVKQMSEVPIDQPFNRVGFCFASYVGNCLRLKEEYTCVRLVHESKLPLFRTHQPLPPF